MGKEQFVGAWRLVSMENRRSDGEVAFPMGQNPIGRIAYDADGRMSVQIMVPGRPAFASGELRGGTPEEMVAAYSGYVAYFGTYHVDEAGGIVTHQVEGSLFPNWVGTSQKRFFTFSGQQVTLSTPPALVSGQQQVALLVWERLE